MPPKRTYDQRFLRYAWIAAQFHGIPDRQLPAFLKDDLGTEPVSTDTIQNSVRDVRAANPNKATGRPEPADGDGEALIWSDWLSVDERGLGLLTALVRIPNDGWDVEPVVSALRKMLGVRQVIVTAEDREVIAVLVFRSVQEGRDIRSQIEEHTARLAGGAALPVRMHMIEFETHEPTRPTWLALARAESPAGAT